MSSNAPQNKRHPGWAGFCILLGLYPVSIALGVLDVAQEDLRAPLWVFAVVGLAFVIVGCMLMLGSSSPWNDLLAGMLCLGFGILGLWVAIYGPAEGFSGGIPLFPHTLNTTIGRWVFGLGSVISFSISGWAFYRWWTAFHHPD